MTTQNYEKRIAELEAKLEKVQTHFDKEVARLTKKISDCEEGMGYYIEKHGKEHCQLLKMVWPAYYKTCPEYIASLSENEIASSDQANGNHNRQS